MTEHEQWALLISLSEISDQIAAGRKQADLRLDPQIVSEAERNLDVLIGHLHRQWFPTPTILAFESFNFSD